MVRVKRDFLSDTREVVEFGAVAGCRVRLRKDQVLRADTRFLELLASKERRELLEAIS